jgi:hypothetical protein
MQAVVESIMAALYAPNPALTPLAACGSQLHWRTGFGKKTDARVFAVCRSPNKSGVSDTYEGTKSTS